MSIQNLCFCGEIRILCVCVCVVCVCVCVGGGGGGGGVVHLFIIWLKKCLIYSYKITITPGMFYCFLVLTLSPNSMRVCFNLRRWLFMWWGFFSSLYISLSRSGKFRFKSTSLPLALPFNQSFLPWNNENTRVIKWLVMNLSINVIKDSPNHIYSGPEVKKLFSYEAQLTQSIKFILLKNLKLLAISNPFLLNIADHENFSANKYENANYCWHFRIY